MPTDTFPRDSINPTSPLRNGFAITPHDTNELSTRPRSLWVGVEGQVTVVLNGTTLTFKGVQGLLPIRPEIVKATDTDATDILGLY